MRWVLLFICSPVCAGEFSVLADVTASDRETGFGLEYSIGESWKPSALLATYRGDFDESSWYGGFGVSKSLVTYNEWDFSASVHALYFKHGGEDVQFFPGTGEPYVQGGSVIAPADMTLTRRYGRESYVAPSPALRLSYQRFGVSLAAIQLPDEEWSTSLGLRYTF